MTYEMKPLSCNPAKLKGLSEKLIVSHYENLESLSGEKRARLPLAFICSSKRGALGRN
jgi:hypothetical protein